MRRFVPMLAVAALGGALTVLAAPISASAATKLPDALSAGHQLASGQAMRSANGAYTASLWPSGTLVITYRGHATWIARSHLHGSKLLVGRDGNVVLAVGRHLGWESGTTESGATDRLVLENTGDLVLRSPYGVAWSSQLGNGCGSNTVAKRFIVSIGHQLGRMCAGRRQLLVTAVTTGASARGDGTPVGTWRVQAKQANTVLHPAAGGAYPVRYWVPYNGAYGVHDSSWQTFAYGSSRYRTQGSHGCVHLPGAQMAWFFRWVAVGSTVTITA